MKERILFKINIKNIGLIVLLAFFNTVLFYLAQRLKLPFWLDTIGTMAAAIQFGPLAGIITGFGSSFLEKLFFGNSFLYSIVAAATGLIVGFLITNKRRHDNLTLVSVGLLTGTVSALLSIPLNAVSQQGGTGNLWGDALKAMLERTVSTPEVNTFASVAFVGVPDRVLSVFAALFLLRMIAPLFRNRGDKHKQAAKTGAALTALLLTVSMMPMHKVHAEDFAADYETVTYSSKEGIFNSAVNAVAQTKDGFLWVGTYSGLYMYDGVKFEETKLHDSINTVKELMVDKKGRLWIGTNDRGVVCYDPSDKSTVLYSTKNGLSSDSIRAICEDTNGNIYVGTALSVSKITPEGSIKTYLEWRDILLVQSLVPLPDGGVIGVTNGGILFLVRNDLLLDTVECRIEDTSYRCAVRTDDTIYVGSSLSLIDKYRTDGEKLTKTGSFQLKDSKYCNRLRYDASGGGLFYCCENGMGFIQCGTDRIYDMTVPGYSGDISDVCVDHQNNVWFASSKQGLMKYAKTPFRNLFNQAKLTANVVNAVLKDGEQLYVGTDSGMHIIDLKNNRLIASEATELLKEDRIRNIYKDSHGAVWVSTFGQHGLVCVEPDGTAVCISSGTEALNGLKFRSVTELSDGRILCAKNMGLIFLREGRPVCSLSDKEGLNNRSILSMLEREDGTILAASDGDGIYIIKNDKVVGHIGAEEGLETSVIMRIVKCSGGFLYVTSNGLYYDENGKVRRLKNFPYSNNYDVLIDKDGTCYITSSAGLFIISEDKLIADETYACTLLNESWGLKSSFTANSWNVIEQGRLYLCCTDGTRMISANDYRSEEIDYQMHLKSIEADGKTVSDTNGTWIVPSETRRFLLNIAVNNFSLSNPRIHYYLDGTGDDGITCYQNEITPLSFTNLSYGKYNLHISVLDDLTGAVLKDEIIPIEKEAVMYEYWYFKIYLMLVIVLLFLYILWVIAAIHKKTQSIRMLQHEITTDPMTGILNKAGSVKALEKACAEETGVLMMIDLDSFKLVNDIYGHEMGDRILIRFAELISAELGEENICGRMGGDEFVGFMKHAADEEIEQVTRHLNSELVASARQFMGEDMNIPIGTSIGAVKVPAYGTNFHELFKLADKALYVVKQNGKHGCSFYERSASANTEDSSASKDLSQILQIIGERNEGKGAFCISFDKMQVVYRYLCRNTGISDSAATIIRFSMNGTEKIPDEAMDSFEDQLIVGLRKNDVVSRYADSFFVLLNGLTGTDAEQTAVRLIETWKKPESAADCTADFELKTIGM